MSIPVPGSPAASPATTGTPRGRMRLPSADEEPPASPTVRRGGGRSRGSPAGRGRGDWPLVGDAGSALVADAAASYAPQNPPQAPRSPGADSFGPPPSPIRQRAAYDRNRSRTANTHANARTNTVANASAMMSGAGRGNSASPRFGRGGSGRGGRLNGGLHGGELRPNERRPRRRSDSRSLDLSEVTPSSLPGPGLAGDAAGRRFHRVGGRGAGGGNGRALYGRRAPTARPRVSRDERTFLGGALVCHSLPGRATVLCDVRMNRMGLRDADLVAFLDRFEAELPAVYSALFPSARAGSSSSEGEEIDVMASHRAAARVRRDRRSRGRKLLSGDSGRDLDDSGDEVDHGEEEAVVDGDDEEEEDDSDDDDDDDDDDDSHNDEEVDEAESVLPFLGARGRVVVDSGASGDDELSSGGHHRRRMSDVDQLAAVLGNMDLAADPLAAGTTVHSSASAPLLLISFFLSENGLSGDALARLADVVTSAAFLRVARLRNLYLFRNRIRDAAVAPLARVVERLAAAGAPLLELHLSHNLITEAGARVLFSAVRSASDAYPVDGARPLWLRLEYNYIDVAAAEAILAELALRHCLAADREACRPGHCVLQPPPQLHLFVFGTQYRAASADHLKTVRERVQRTYNASSTGPAADGAAVASGLVADDALQYPLYIFLDTCAVLDMADARRSSSPSGTFSFHDILRRCADGRFGAPRGSTDDARQLTLVVCDTVMSELDHHKSGASRELRALVLKLQSDSGYLQQLVERGVLEMLGADEGEGLVNFADRNVTVAPATSADMTRNALNDRAIVDLALYWKAELGVPRGVLFVTSDVGADEVARRHGLWSVLLRDLSARLVQAGAATAWTPALLRSVLPTGESRAASSLARRTVAAELHAAATGVAALLAVLDRAGAPPLSPDDARAVDAVRRQLPAWEHAAAAASKE